MLRQIHDRDIVNFTINHRHSTRNIREIGLFVLTITVFLVLAIVYIYIPNQMTTVDYQIEQTKQRIQKLTQERETLKLKESELISPRRLEAEAIRLGLRTPDLPQIQYLEQPGGITEGKVRLALNQATERNTN